MGDINTKLYHLPKEGYSNEVIQVPIEIDGVNHVVDIGIDYKKKKVSISHHTRTIDTNKDNGDHSITTFDYKFLDRLIERLNDYNNLLKQD